MLFVSLNISFFQIIFWAVDPPGAQEKVLEIASNLGLNVSVGVAHEVSVRESGTPGL